ncbi:PREDICTED: extracellular serine/threonine protein kinase FAM20C-like [Gekko japonicus]|uniref:Extracellular serine/threonine protein kinase FAM20C-like n=1 Tax=Gekko japonicus TaxID=146911 RepID=A0ABM1KLR9_GEKJA|nr:PREDICTED: extracellular serine/threonine protein kinase FAM20C-like [Gekko japonicus]
MLRHLPSVLQRKFKVVLFFLLLLALLIHMVLDLAFSSGRGSCGCSPKIADPMGLLPADPSAAVQNKLNLRILQDFSGSNGSLEKGSRLLGGTPYPGDRSNMDHQGHSFKHQEAEEKIVWADRSKLAALFDHPLYKIPTPAVMAKDKLFVTNAKIKFQLKSSRSDEWVSGSMAVMARLTEQMAKDPYPPWLRFNTGINRYELYGRHDPARHALLEDLATQEIVSSVQKPGGTQLKIIMTFPNKGKALFKPMKQTRDQETPADFFYFSDFERHNAEIAAFHLDRILDFRRIPPVSGRLVNIAKDIRDITSDQKLFKTFFISPAGNVCFYGVCSYYCSTEHALCGKPDLLEGSMAALLPGEKLAKRRSWRSPWRRSYSKTKKAEWELNQNYCIQVRQTPPYDQTSRLLNLIDMTVLDFLMGNMDRHHYETFEKFGNDTFLLHLDNGRGFGRHSHDELSILAPLQQCCIIKKSTFLRLQLLATEPYRLSDVMRESLAADHLSPVLSEPHLRALDRRLQKVLAVVKSCLTNGEERVVLLDDQGGQQAATSEQEKETSSAA